MQRRHYPPPWNSWQGQGLPYRYGRQPFIAITHQKQPVEGQ
jgi:hypothetical protein